MVFYLIPTIQPALSLHHSPFHIRCHLRLTLYLFCKQQAVLYRCGQSIGEYVEKRWKSDGKMMGICARVLVSKRITSFTLLCFILLYFTLLLIIVFSLLACTITPGHLYVSARLADMMDGSGKNPQDGISADPLSAPDNNKSSDSDNDNIGAPPQDTGERAWLFLFGACIIEIAAWGMYRVDRSTYQADLWAGFPYCYGVFESCFISNPPFEGMTIVSVGGVLCNVRGSICVSCTVKCRSGCAANITSSNHLLCQQLP